MMSVGYFCSIIMCVSDFSQPKNRKKKKIREQLKRKNEESDWKNRHSHWSFQNTTDVVVEPTIPVESKEKGKKKKLCQNPCPKHFYGKCYKENHVNTDWEFLESGYEINRKFFNVLDRMIRNQWGKDDNEARRMVRVRAGRFRQMAENGYFKDYGQKLKLCVSSFFSVFFLWGCFLR